MSARDALRVLLAGASLAACADPAPAPPRDGATDAAPEAGSADASPDLAPDDVHEDARAEPLEDEPAPDADPPDVDPPDVGPPDVGPPDVGPPDVLDATADVRLDAVADARLDAVADARPDAVADARLDAVADARPDVPPIDAPVGAWRSALFPDDWVPVHAGGRPDGMGRFLHDFSFAGYRRGERPRYGAGTVVRTVDASLGDGRTDARAAIQAAIDAACAATVTGLRVVAIPAGTFLLRFPTATPANDPALRVACSNLVIRGAGPSATSLLLDDPRNARSRALLRVAARSYNVWSGATSAAITRDLPRPTRTIRVASTAGFSVGDVVSVRTDITEGFRAAHRMNRTEMGEVFWAASTAQGLLYPRRVVDVDVAAGTVTLDAPTRYGVLQRDNARLVAPSGYLESVGLEDFAFGMREHPTSAAGTAPGPLGDAADEAYATAGTAAYAVHGSVGIRLDATRDAWLHRVETFAPAGNASGAHVLSNALFLTAGTHRVTVERCRLARPQYRGGGGNGYLFWTEGSDNLLVDDVATAGRHNFITAHIASSGNVVLRARTVDSRYADDTHRLLAQANLFDSVSLEGAWLQAVNRGATSSGAGFSATETVFWNTRVVRSHPSTRRAADGFAEGFAIETAQFGWGYAIGTSGAGSAVATRVLTNSYWATLDSGPPADFVEGVGRGATLFPQSLYDEQRRRRLLRGE